MAKENDYFKKIISHAKEYGFDFPSSEIYDERTVYDYGQNCCTKTIFEILVEINDSIT